MNIAFFIRPKQDTDYLYEDFTVRQALEKMKNSGFAALPVINREGKYVGIVSEGDFLRLITEELGDETSKTLCRQTEKIPLSSLIRRDRYHCATFSDGIEALFLLALDQNFVPVVDDTGSFSGIVTRRSIMEYFLTEKV